MRAPSDDGGGGGRARGSDESAAAAAATAGDAAAPAAPDRGGSVSERLDKLTRAYEMILEAVGEDTGRSGLKDTPRRAAQAMLDLTDGYSQTARGVVGRAVFEEASEGMVIVKGISVHSLCEHHLLPFHGVVHIGYLPRGKVLGLSKLARIVKVFANRLQVQEKLTREIAAAINSAVDAAGVAVVIECSHMCMSMRGVAQVGSTTTTSSMLGAFDSSTKIRSEFYAHLGTARV